ncbi:hypothetical protein TMP248_200009 [Tenacibaculum maritimum]|nr:hypothetical protein TMP248_200009 [Tenacibaculum maritimum]CAA0233877.1 hypothetical protein NACSLCCMFF_50114 [Tenacibaculum maritimum]
MVSRFIYFSIIFSLLSCNSIELRKLSNLSNVKVPKDNSFYKEYDEKLNVQLPSNIDLTSLYEYAYQIDYKNKKFFNTRKNNKSAFKFYKKGRVNLFYYDENKKNNFDSNKYGYRGICYKEKNNFKLLFIAPITENRKYGVQNYKMEMKGDTLLISLIKKHLTEDQIFTDVYIKKDMDSPVNQVDW